MVIKLLQQSTFRRYASPNAQWSLSLPSAVYIAWWFFIV